MILSGSEMEAAQVLISSEVLVVGGLVFGRHDEHLAGEAVPVSVQGAGIARFQFELNEIVFAVRH